MSDYILLENPPETPVESFEPFFYNTEVYQNTFSDLDQKKFWYYDESAKVARAKLSFRIEGNCAISPVKATFGGLDYETGLNEEVTDSFLREVHNRLKAAGIQHIYITTVPDKFFPAFSTSEHDLLIAHGYRVIRKELDFFTFTHHSEFRSLLHRYEKNRLNKCIKAGFKAQREEFPDTLELYNLLVRNRQDRGYPVTMDYNTFAYFITRFPGHYPVFTVRDGSRLVGVAIAVVVHSSLLYIFYNAHDSDYKRYSPVVMANAAVYHYAREGGFSILDYGIATEDGIPNNGLIKFKKRMGGIPALKLVWEKLLK